MCLNLTRLDWLAIAILAVIATRCLTLRADRMPRLEATVTIAVLSAISWGLLYSLIFRLQPC